MQFHKEVRREVHHSLHAGLLFRGAYNTACIERDSAQLLRKIQYLFIGLRPAQRRAGQYILDAARLADPRPKAAHQQGRLHPGGPLVDMCLVKHNELQLCAGEHGIILWTEHHILQHRVISDKNMGRGTLHDFAGNDFIRGWLQRIAICVPIGAAIFC